MSHTYMVLDMVNTSRRIISQECDDHFFGKPVKTAVGRKHLSIKNMKTLYQMYLILSLSSVIVFELEIVFAQITKKFCNTSRINNEIQSRKSLEMCFINEYEEFRQEWCDLLFLENTLLTHLSAANLRCFTLIDNHNK